MERFALRPRGPYALAASVRFLEGFVPAAYDGVDPDHLHLAVVADDGAAAGVCVRDEGGVVVGETVGKADRDVVRAQVARILSLDVDGGGFPAVGQRDPVIGRLQARYPGLRPVLFYSPYEAAAWALIGQRIRITRAARLKARLAAEVGPTVTVHGERLRALGVAAAEGALDAARLQALPPEEALARLKELPGIGGFSAHLILPRAGRASRTTGRPADDRAAPGPRRRARLRPRWPALRDGPHHAKQLGIKRS